MVIVDGWSSLATRHNGLTDKKYSTSNAGLGICCHSIEGSIAGALSRFDSTAKDARGRYTPSAAASCMWLNPKVGRLIQCYPVTASTWTSGNFKANTELWAVESEGVAGELLNANQVANMLTLRDEWQAYKGQLLTRESVARTLHEHREVWNWESPNAGPTACPSGRYQPFFAELEDHMADPRVDAIIDALGGLAAIDAWNAQGNSLLVGYALEQVKLAEHIANHAAGVNGDVSEHAHTPGGVKR